MAMVVVFGIVLTLIGIGCAIMARSFFIGERRFSEGGMGHVALLFSAGAALTLAIAIILFVRAYISGKGKK